jgi:hypothetical protein
LPGVLRAAGYRTAAVSANLWVSRASGFDIGFDDFEQVHSGRHARIDRMDSRGRLRWIAEGVRGVTDDGARAISGVLGKWFGDSPRPFFCFVNLLEGHSPYLPPRPYGDLSLLDRIRAAEDARRYYTLLGIWRTCSGIDRVPDAALERARRLYAASIRYMDDWLARLLESLDAAKALDDTLVIVTSDHGENLGEGGLIAHAMSLDNRLIHVPLVAAGPGAESAGFSSLAALPRFISDCAGATSHPYDEDLPQGIGVAQFDPPLDADDRSGIERLERMGLGVARDAFTTPLTCAVSEDLKLLLRGSTEEVYDLVADPLELKPLPPGALSDASQVEVLARLRSALSSSAVVSQRGPEASTTVESAQDEEGRDLEERMKLLGYM